MMIDNPLLQYAEAPEPKIAFPCDIWGCKNDIYVGQIYTEKSGHRLCDDCAGLYGKNGERKIAEEW